MIEAELLHPSASGVRYAVEPALDVDVRYRLGLHPDTGARVLVWHDILADPDAVTRTAKAAQGIPGVLAVTDHVFPQDHDARFTNTLYVTPAPDGTSLATTMKAFGWLDDAMLLAVLHGLLDVLQRLLGEGFLHPSFAEQDDEVFFGATPPITLLQPMELRAENEMAAPRRAELMAPEVLGRAPLHDPRIYVYRVGMLAYQWLTGESYFRGKGHYESIPHFLHDLVLGPMPKPSERAAERNGVQIPRWFDTWFALATDRDPEERFPSLREAQIALRRLGG
ncbi:MAG: hypothetical protein ACXWUG_02480 [Polyangiales bacterium]